MVLTMSPMAMWSRPMATHMACRMDTAHTTVIPRLLPTTMEWVWSNQWYIKDLPAFTPSTPTHTGLVRGLLPDMLTHPITLCILAIQTRASTILSTEA